MESQTQSEKVEIISSEELWNWLDKHHSQYKSVWLVTWKASHRSKYVSKNEVLDALIAYGWVDGRSMKLDDDRTMHLLAPRKEQRWARTYKDRAEKLEMDGRMKEPGRIAIRESKKSGKWSELDHVDNLEEPEDLLEVIAEKKATSWWSKAAPSYRRNVLRWLAIAKKSETRQKRINIIAHHASRGEKVPQY